ncbi:hypothetical protein [Cellulomonas sp. IC4_254]|uniref:hypothetical protein n=1 Tax=Cellulomonas sp. IC4_254 TaxID=2714040 RepID=UPI00142459D2|nr:hypothetical protein [Cellulomonas sp. IC4_254]NHT19212.1 hypothetical protein [Cellulomonas sp. IC4_254]
MIRLLLSAVIGFFVASVVLRVADLDAGWEWAFGVSLGVMVPLMILVTIGRTFAGARPARPQDVEAALRENRVSLAKVLETRATGTTINDQPLCEIRLVVASRTRPAYTTTTRSVINLGRLPGLQRGAVVVVAQLDAERPEVALLDPAPAGWQDVADRDTHVRDLPEAPVWDAPPPRGRDRRGLVRIPAVLLLVLALVGFGARVWPVRDEALALVQGTPLEEVQAEAAGAAAGTGGEEEQPAPAVDLFSAAHTRPAIDDLVAVAGGSQFTEVGIYGDYIVAEGLTAPGEPTTDRYTWRDGEAARDGAAPIQPDPAALPDELFDVTAVDWSLVEPLVAQVPELTGITAPGGPSVLVRRATDPGVTTPVELHLWVSDEYYDAYLTADATGTVVSMHGGRPGSPAEAWEAAHGG